MFNCQRLVSVFVTGVLSLSISIYLVYRFDTEKLGGYVAAYTTAFVWVLSVFVGLLGGGLLIPRRTRRGGEMVLASAFAIPCLFFAGIHVSESRGWISWLNEPLQTIVGPNVQASEIVYYKLEVTPAEIEHFQDTVLYRARLDGKGADFVPGITSFWSLDRSQAHGHAGFAIGISPNMPETARRQLRSAFSKSPLVFAVYHDIAPDDVPVR